MRRSGCELRVRRCDGCVAPRRTQKLQEFCAFPAESATAECDGCDARFAPRRRQKGQGFCGFPTESATGRAKVRTRNRALSLALYRAAPPRTRFGPGRTRDFSGLAGATAEWRTFRSTSRPTKISTKTSAQDLKSKTARSRDGGAAETQSSRMPHTRCCDGHCQAFWRGGSGLSLKSAGLDGFASFPNLPYA